MLSCSAAQPPNRKDNWEDQEVRALITLWSEDTVQRDLKQSGRNINIYRRIATRLARLCGDERGERNATACRTKIKSLTQAYKKVKNNNNCSGRDRQTFCYFDLMDAILGTRPTAAPLAYMDTYLMDLATDDPTQQLVVATEEEIDEAIQVDVEIELESQASAASNVEATQTTPAAREPTQPTPATQAAQAALRKKKGKAPGKTERFLDAILTQFVAAQEASATLLHDREDNRVKLELEMEERREERQDAREERREERRDERERVRQHEQRNHEERMLQLLVAMHNPTQPATQQFRSATTDGVTRITLVTPPSRTFTFHPQQQFSVK